MLENLIAGLEHQMTIPTRMLMQTRGVPLTMGQLVKSGKTVRRDVARCIVAVSQKAGSLRAASELQPLITSPQNLGSILVLQGLGGQTNLAPIHPGCPIIQLAFLEAPSFAPS